jgi:hypothetical protein
MLKTRTFYPFFIPAVIFLFLKITSLGIRFSDTNIYFYTAYKVLQGKVLYKDIFFTNFPLFIYISSLYHMISGGNLLFYYFTSSLEITATAFLIYILALRKTKETIISIMSASLYFFSYLVLATSDHQTGVFIGAFFAVLSYFFYERKRFLLSGIIVGCMLLTKAYFLPVLLAYLISFPLVSPKWKREVLPFLLGVVITSIIILFPTLLLARQEFYNDIVKYSLIRPQGVSKLLIFNAVIRREFLLFIIFIISLFAIKKFHFFSILSFLSLLFFLFYKDFYFYYLNILAPFLCIFFASIYHYVHAKYHPQRYIIPSILIGIFFINFIQYSSTTRNQKIDDFQKVVTTIKKFNPPTIYGTNDIAPALSYMTDIPLLDEIIDTNPTIFRKGFLQSGILTNEALRKRALLIGHGVEYPEFNVKQDLVDEIFDKSKLSAKCKFVGNFPEKTEGYENRLQLVTCP